MREYPGGIADWKEHGGPVEGLRANAENRAVSESAASARARRLRERVTIRHQWGNAILDLIERRSTGQLFLVWLGMIFTCGVAYWGGNMFSQQSLLDDGRPIGSGAWGLLTAIYFSFVTATSVGYGDVVPRGGARLLAVVEAVSGLLIFGAVVAKFVSRRQDEMMAEIHRVTFEDRLDRVQTNLHLVISELQAMVTLCESGAGALERAATRLESAVLVFAGELRAIHELLYHPQHAAPEPILGAILASLSSALGTLRDAMACLPRDFRRSLALEKGLHVIAELSQDICAECVPQVFAPALSEWMDRVQQAARQIR